MFVAWYDNTEAALTREPKHKLLSIQNLGNLIGALEVMSKI